jgi:CheY-specific phosphatase CheX
MSTLAQAPLNETLGEDITAAVEKTFTQMFGSKVTSAFKVIPRENTPTGDVTAIMQLAQVEPQGALMITFPQTTLFALLKKFYKRDFTEIDKTVVDAVGEITNIIFGGFKQKVRAKNFQFRNAMPSLSSGGAPRIASVIWTLHGEFQSDFGPFHVVLMQVGSKLS